MSAALDKEIAGFGIKITVLKMSASEGKADALNGVGPTARTSKVGGTIAEVAGENRKTATTKGSLEEWWARLDSNQQPDGYEPSALTN